MYLRQSKYVIATTKNISSAANFNPSFPLKKNIQHYLSNTPTLVKTMPLLSDTARDIPLCNFCEDPLLLIFL